jgi:hypothetical protein
MAETSLPVTPGSGVNVAGNTDGAGNFLQSVGIEDTSSGGVANVQAGDSNGLVTNHNTKTISFSTSASGAQILQANTDTRAYAWISIVLTSVGSGLAWTGQFAPNSGGTYITTTTWEDASSSTGTPGGLGTSNNKIYGSPVQGDFFQLNITALTSGTLSGYIILSTMPHPYHSFQIASSSSTGSAVPSTAYLQGVNARTSAPTNAGTGNLTGILGNVMGMPVVANALLNSAVAVSSSLTVVKASAGYLSGILVTTAGTSTAMTVYDNASAASGTAIGVIPATATAGSYWPFNMPAANGITCSGSATNPAVTVAYS